MGTESGWPPRMPAACRATTKAGQENGGLCRGRPLTARPQFVLAGQPSPSLVTHFGITATNTSMAGSSFSITVTALNSSNNPVAGYNGTGWHKVTDTVQYAIMEARGEEI